MAVIACVFLIFGAIGCICAEQRNRSGATWFVLCAVCFLPALVILFCLPPLPKKGAAMAGTAARYDVARWAALLEADAEIAAAAERVREQGARYVDVLAEKYLVLDDKSYLPVLVEQVEAMAAADRAQSGDTVDPALFDGATQQHYAKCIYQLGEGGVCRAYGGGLVGWLYFQTEQDVRQAIDEGRVK